MKGITIETDILEHFYLFHVGVLKAIETEILREKLTIH